MANRNASSVTATSLGIVEAPLSSSTTVTKAVANKVYSFLKNVGVSSHIPENSQSNDCYSNLMSNLIKVEHLQRGRISGYFSVLPLISNYFGGLHGGAVAAIAERMAVACARTVVTEDKDIFLGDLSVSYLSTASKDEELVVDASVLRSGKNLTVVSMEFIIKKTGKLAFTARAIFFNMPLAKM